MSCSGLHYLATMQWYQGLISASTEVEEYKVDIFERVQACYYLVVGDQLLNTAIADVFYDATV